MMPISQVRNLTYRDVKLPKVTQAVRDRACYKPRELGFLGPHNHCLTLPFLVCAKLLPTTAIPDFDVG